MPLKRHIHKGMYGAFIIDPREGREPAREMTMIMNAFDTNFDGGNEIYAVTTVGHQFMRRPIPVKVGERIRLYLINVVEFAELGWMGFFNAVDPADYNAALAEVGLDEEWEFKGTHGSTTATGVRK